MQNVRVACAVRVNPPAQFEFVLLLFLGRPEVIQESLHVLLHDRVKFLYHRFVHLEHVERIMPSAGIGPLYGILLSRPQTPCEFLKASIQMNRALLAAINPGRKQRHNADFHCRSFGDLDGSIFPESWLGHDLSISERGNRWSS